MGILIGSTQHLTTSGELQNISSLDSTTETTISNAVSSSISSGSITIPSSGYTLVGYGAGAGLNGTGNFDMKANTSYLFYAPNGGPGNNIYIYQNNSLNDRLVNGISNFAGMYVYANGSTARSDVGMGGVSGGNPGPHLIFEIG